MGKTKLNYETLREAYFFLPGECRNDKAMITDMIRYAHLTLCKEETAQKKLVESDRVKSVLYGHVE